GVGEIADSSLKGRCAIASHAVFYRSLIKSDALRRIWPHHQLLHVPPLDLFLLPRGRAGVEAPLLPVSGICCPGMLVGREKGERVYKATLIPPTFPDMVLGVGCGYGRVAINPSNYRPAMGRPALDSLQQATPKTSTGV